MLTETECRWREEINNIITDQFMFPVRHKKAPHAFFFVNISPVTGSCRLCMWRNPNACIDSISVRPKKTKNYKDTIRSDICCYCYPEPSCIFSTSLSVHILIRYRLHPAADRGTVLKSDSRWSSS